MSHSKHPPVCFPVPYMYKQYARGKTAGLGKYSALQLVWVLYITLAQVLKRLLVLYNALARTLEFSLALYIPYSHDNKTIFLILISFYGSHMHHCKYYLLAWRIALSNRYPNLMWYTKKKVEQCLHYLDLLCCPWNDMKALIMWPIIETSEQMQISNPEWVEMTLTFLWCTYTYVIYTKSHYFKLPTRKLLIALLLHLNCRW